MADPVKQTKLAINKKKQEVHGAETERAKWAAELKDLESLVETVGANQELDNMRAEIESYIAAQDKILQRALPELATLEAELPQVPEPAAPKFDPEKHPLLRKALEKQEPEKAVVFSTGDMCEAQWTDKAWYKAKIQSILGSASAPKYLVRFLEYDDSITVDRSAVRPLPSRRKREAETATAPLSTAPTMSTPNVISGPASVNPNAQAAKTTADTAEPKKTNRIANQGTLKKRASNWQDFQAKTSKKMPKKESMFRTSTNVGSRVGFTGSGNGMTETHKRKRYDHKADVEEDGEYEETAPPGRKRF